MSDMYPLDKRYQEEVLCDQLFDQLYAIKSKLRNIAHLREQANKDKEDRINADAFGYNWIAKKFVNERIDIEALLVLFKLYNEMKKIEDAVANEPPVFVPPERSVAEVEIINDLYERKLLEVRVGQSGDFIDGVSSAGVNVLEEASEFFESVINEKPEQLY